MGTLPKVSTWLIMTTLALAGVGLCLHPGQGFAWLSYFDAWLMRIVYFSLMQAFLSASLAVVIAIPFAWVLSRSVFRGQWVVKGFLNLFFIMPVLSIILGVINAYSGLLNVFSLTGIVIAHLLLNIPFAIRILWQRLSSISLHQRYIGQTLGFNKFQEWRWLDWPLIKTALGPVFLLIFLLCFSSFAIVLTLGGGPANTNLEVAIFQTLKFDFDPKGAAIYASIHGGITLLFMLVFGRKSTLPIEQTTENAINSKLPTLSQNISILLLIVIFLYPIFSLIQQATSVPWIGSNRFFQALLTSLLLAGGSSLVTVSLALLNSFVEKRSKVQQVFEYGLLILPMMVVTTGLFLFFLKVGLAFKVTGFLIVWLNGLMAMPLISPLINARINIFRNRYSPLVQTLGLSPLSQWSLVYWPAVRKVLPWSFALSSVLSIGDLGVAALIGSAQFVTLPILIYQAMGSYQMILASQLTIAMLLMCGLIIAVGEWFSDRGTHVGNK